VPASTTRARLEACLSDVDFPVGKDELTATAERHGDLESARALRAIPPVVYANLTEVFGAVRFDDDTGRTFSGS
jgi:hypothetical protein